MWSKRKARNRRFERKHVLDVKLRASHRRQLRLRRAVLATGVPFFVLFGLYVAWRGAEWALDQLIFRNAAFAIHQIDVQTDGVLSAEQIRRWAGVKLEDNLFALDLARVKRDLELIPHVQSAAIERVLPHGLKIRVIEREPIAQCRYPAARGPGSYEEESYLLDAQGYLMPPLEPHQRSDPAASNGPLPVLVGMAMKDFRPGKAVESPQARAALRFLEAFDCSAMAEIFSVEQIDLTTANFLQVKTGQNCEATFGWGDFETHLRRWRAVCEHARRTGRHLAWLDLSVANNVPARWLEPGLIPPGAVRLPPPTRPKKKHV